MIKSKYLATTQIPAYIVSNSIMHTKDINCDGIYKLKFNNANKSSQMQIDFICNSPQSAKKLSQLRHNFAISALFSGLSGYL